MIDLSIVVPVYNEEKSLEIIINKVLKIIKSSKFTFEIIIVNDGSKDSSLKIAKKIKNENPEIKLLDNEKNIGKSMTVKKGILESKGNWVVIQDSDLEYDPNDIVNILNLAKEKKLDFVYGNRFGGNNKLIYKSFYLGNKFVTLFSNLFTFVKLKKYIPDMEVCYKLIKGNIARSIAKDLTATSNFGFEPEVTAKLAKYKLNGKHLKFDIIPISYFPRTIEQGKKIRWKDGYKALFEIIKYNM